MPQGRITPGQLTKSGNKPWQPGHVIGERQKRHIAISYAAAKQLPDYQAGIIDAAIAADTIILSFQREVK